jgi:CheY-like chemotaxis protein
MQRTSKAEAPTLPPRDRLVICDETGELHGLLAPYWDEVEIVETRNLSQAVEEVQRCPAHAVVLNAESPDLLRPLVERARSQMPDTPILGCALPARARYALAASVVDHLVKPVTRAELTKAVQAIGEPVQRVLIVDDDPQVQQVFARMLSSSDGSITIATAASGQQALEFLHTFSPDLMLLDLIMPDMDGWQVMATKGEDEAVRDIPVILVSAQDPVQPPTACTMLLATIDRGLSPTKVWRSVRWFTTLLPEPD